MNLTSLLILVAAAWAGGALLFLRARVAAYGRRELFAAPAGSPAAGIRYAFTKGMRPDAKESVREHLPSYLAGMAYHAGTFTAFGVLALSLVHVAVPTVAVWPMRVLLAAGFAGGLSLFLKRLFKAELRGLSNPDDFVSNLLVTAFVGLALTPLHAVWQLSAIALLVYVPLGKIRHCLFFFSTRAAFGAYFGRRGVFPDIKRGGPPAPGGRDVPPDSPHGSIGQSPLNPSTGGTHVR